MGNSGAQSANYIFRSVIHQRTGAFLLKELSNIPKHKAQNSAVFQVGIPQVLSLMGSLDISTLFLLFSHMHVKEYSGIQKILEIQQQQQ